MATLRHATEFSPEQRLHAIAGIFATALLRGFAQNHLRPKSPTQPEQIALKAAVDGLHSLGKNRSMSTVVNAPEAPN